MIEALTDAPARDSARLDLDHNAVVEAGAGTGKTTLLIDRIIFLLLGRRKNQSALEMSRLVALTFTEKAAAEIKFRLAERLHHISALARGARPDQSTAAARCLEDLRTHFQRSLEDILALAQASLRDIERAQIGTIHSFCAHILRLYPLEAGVDPDFRVDAREEELERMFEEEWALWLDGELSCDAPRPQLWRETLSQASLEGLADLARELVSPRVDLEAAEKSPGVAHRLREMERRIARLGQGQGKPRGSIREYLTWMRAQLSASAAAVQGHSARGTLAPSSSIPAWPSNWDSEDRIEYERLAKLVRRLDPQAEAVYPCAVRVLKPFVESFRAAYQRRGLVTFDGLLKGARDLLQGNLRVRCELKSRFSALLIDEFQDTDPLQVELLMFLAEESQSRAQVWTEVVCEPGKLFIVGDPKQSIYRFRGADIAALESFSGHLARQGANLIALQANFRSSPAIVDSVNGVFQAVMRPTPGLQPAYVPIHAAGRSAGPGPQWLRPPSLKPGLTLRAEDRRRAEADWIARWILHERGSYRLKDIAVMLRSTTALSLYLEALKRSGIQYVVEGEKYFYGTQEVTDFVNLLRVIDDPQDRIALAGLLRSPLAALSDRDIYRLAQADLLDYGQELPMPWGDLAGFYACLRGLHAAAGREPLGELVSAMVRDTHLVELASRAYHHQQTASNLLKLVRSAAEASDRGDTLKEFLSSISASVRDLREEGESPLADEDYDAVRVLTIHKAKGLEYPVVILPNLGGAVLGRASQASLRVGWSWPAIGLRLKGCPAANAAMALLDAEEELRQRQEEVRVFYVAMTRAKERLFLLGGVGRSASCFAALLEEAACLQSRPLELEKMQESVSKGQVSSPGWVGPDPKQWARLWEARLKREKTALAHPLFMHPTGVESAPETRVFQRQGGGGSGVWLGRLCHEVLERWDFANSRSLGENASLETLIQQRAAGLRREASAPSWAQIQQEAHRILSSFFESKTGRELASAQILGREVPFVFARDQTVVRGTLDLLYRQGAHTVIADYKTDSIEAGSRDKLTEKYRRQGEFYVEAAERVLGIREVEFNILFLRET